MSARKKCAFCRRDDRKISNEHAFPTWAKACLPQQGSLTVDNRRAKDGFQAHPWTTHDTLGIPVNEICKPCNEGWLHRLEETVRPFACNLIGGRPTVLQPQQATDLATWVHKTLLVFDLTHGLNRRAFTHAERRAFHDFPFAKLSGLSVFLGHYSGNVAGTAYTRERGNFVLKNGKRMSYGNGTFTLGRLLFEVVAYDPEPLPPPKIWIPHAHAEFRDSLIRLWPLFDPGRGAADPLHWPPPRSFDNSMLLTLIRRSEMHGSIASSSTL